MLFYEMAEVVFNLHYPLNANVVTVSCFGKQVTFDAEYLRDNQVLYLILYSILFVTFLLVFHK